MHPAASEHNVIATVLGIVDSLSAYSNWDRQSKRAPNGFRAAKRATDKAMARLNNLEYRILFTRAVTIERMAAKARLSADSELQQLLTRAFERAWDQYYRPGRSTIAPEDARPALAKRLVALSKDGVRDEERLAIGGLIHLRLLAVRSEVARGY
jgi:hypothetical protein